MEQLNRTNDICDNISIRGYSHIKTDKECQDNSVSWQGTNYSGIIVCDGHGGDKYIRSSVGSSLACEIGKNNISLFMDKFEPDDARNIDTSLEQLERSIVSCWYSAVQSDYEAHPITEDERYQNLEDTDKTALVNNPVKAYGSTFIAAVKTDSYCFVLKLGDGNTVFMYSDGSSEMPEELVDDDCMFNITTSLCNNDAALSFKHCFRTITKENDITGIMLTSDGIINCYRSEEAYIGFMENAFYAYGEDETETAREELSGVLDRLSEKGSGDDLSLAIIRMPISENEKERYKIRLEKQETERIKREAQKALEEAERIKREAEEAKKKAEAEKLAAEKAKEEAEKAKNEAEAVKEEAESKAAAAEKTESEVFVVKESVMDSTDIFDFISETTVSAKEVIHRVADEAKKMFGNKND